MRTLPPEAQGKRDLAGGMVTSQTAPGDSGLVVAVVSNIARAGTSALGLTIGDAFAGQAR